ncbi:hypothetical protein PT115_09140, partial [Erysipelothrix rhusiopathiae]|nr:hypothetical protein [Erysipelothrix rhusiopathiae]
MGFVTVEIVRFCVEKKMVITMPESVPS